MNDRTRPTRRRSARTGRARIAFGLSGLLLLGPLAAAPATAAPAPAALAGATFIDLASAADYSVLAGTGVANTGAATVLAADLGLSPSGAITGFPPGTTAGTIHDKDAAAEQAQSDRQAAYDAAVAQPSTAAFAGDIAGTTFKPGVHTSVAAVTNSGTVTLDADGDPSAVFVFQIGAALSSAAASKVVLTDGALANNVYWQVVGAVSLGAGASFVGTFLAAGAISFGEGAKLKGRALTPGTVTLANSPIAISKDDLTPPVVTIDGGPGRFTKDTTPAISGTTDEPLGTAVTVTVGGQTLTTAVNAAGTWGVGATELTPGPHDVLASVTDASRNTGTASQVLTVDTTAPLVTIAGGGSRATKDTTPVISGLANEPGATVTVTVAGQTLTSPVAANGAWSVLATTLAEAAHLVVASLADAAGNTGSATQVLTVDTTVPVVSINGGDTRSTNDTSPWIFGTSAEKAGTTVRVAVAGQSLRATVEPGGAWGVSARMMSSGPHRVVAAITDAAGNTGTDTQILTVGGVDPGPTFRPDAAIRRAGGKFVGAGAYGPDQRVTQQLRTRRTATFEVRLANRGDSADALVVRGARRTAKFKVTYLVGGRNVTAEVSAGTYRTSSLAPGAVTLLVVKVTRTARARAGDRRAFEIRAASAHAPARQDTVTAVVRR
ncbi:MAG: ice-binding family protein [Nocardioides sp.]|nr:ice-binding family protein [Nocardioides sp.]